MPNQSSATTFNSGEVRARFGRGVVRFERFALVSSLAQLFIEGTVTLQGRLNLDVTANTGRLGINPAAPLVRLRIPATGPMPVALLVQVTDYLSNRVIHLRVTGTVKSPTITVEPLSLLTEEAARFFLGRSNLPVTAPLP